MGIIYDGLVAAYGAGHFNDLYRFHWEDTVGSVVFWPGSDGYQAEVGYGRSAEESYWGSLSGGGGGGDILLLESGDGLLLESGDNILLD